MLRLCCLFTATNHLAEEKAKQDGSEVFGYCFQPRYMYCETDRLKWVPKGSAQNACSPVKKTSTSFVIRLPLYQVLMFSRVKFTLVPKVPFYDREKLGRKDAPGDVAITWETPAVHVLGNVNIYAFKLPWDVIFNIFRCEILQEKNSLETRRRPVL